MDIAVIGNPYHLSCRLPFRQLLPVKLRRFGAKGPDLPRLPRCILELQVPHSLSGGSEPSPSSRCGGWEDLTILDGDTDALGFVDRVRRFLASMGLHGKEQAFLFCMGFLSALAISRVRLSVMAILPASAVLFAAGMSVGVAQGGASLADWLERGGSGNDPLKVEFLVGFLDDLELKMAELNSGLEGAVTSSRLGMGEVKRYLVVVELVRSGALSAKKLILEYLSDGSSAKESVSIEGAELERKSSTKGTSKKKKEKSEIGFDVIRFFGGLLQESFMSAKGSKAKDSPARENTTSILFDKGQDGSLQQASCLTDASDKNTSSLVPTSFEESTKAIDSTGVGVTGTSTSWNCSPERLGGSTQNMTAKSEDERSGIPSYATAKNQGEPSSSDRISNDDADDKLLSEEYGHRDIGFHLNGRHRSWKRSVFHYKSHRDEMDVVRKKFGKDSRGEMDFNLRETQELHTFSERGSSMHSNSIFEVRDKTYSRENEEQKLGFGNTGSPVKNTASEIKTMDNQKQHRSSVEINIASSSAITADDEFNQNLKEAGDLLKRARECLKKEDDEETAGIILCRSAKLLSTAVALKPMSLLAVGQLGNTFLLHGELKLKTTRELRVLLSENDNSASGGKNRSHLKASIKPHLSKDAVFSLLVDTCEECEELLVDAGSMYKKALSIDNDDIRALYNWGLALSYRAQLIRDIGPEAAIEADKIYLAAIDKFAAMTSKSNKHAPEALFRWGLTLQERSQLHPYDIGLKMKLLKQAKSMYEDVLRVDRNNPIVREALFSCISELNLNRQSL